MTRTRLLALAALVGLALSVTACAPTAAPMPAQSTPPASTGASETPGSVASDAPLVAFYGDSYTRGTGASDPSRRWSTIIAESRGWEEFNPSVDGLGFINHRETRDPDLPGEIVEADPDIVLVTMGLNDVFSYDRAGDRIRRQIGDDLAFLREGLPEARIVVVEPFWYTEERPEALEVIIGWVEDAAADIDADFIPGASTWIQGRKGEMAADGLHPSDAGYAEIAERMDAALAGIGL